MRVAVVASPRAGNTWLRGLLAGLAGAQQRAWHTPGEVPWGTLPEQFVLQIHWQPETQFVDLLRANAFSVVTVARHPLDLLMSILHFCRHEPQTSRWLDGAGGTEDRLVGAAPDDDVVREYAASPRFRALLSVTDAWWDLATTRVRYEDLVTNTHPELKRLAADLGLPATDTAVERVVSSLSLDAIRPTSSNHHYWQGAPGGWRRLLPAEIATDLARPVHDVLARYGYPVDPVEALDRETARATWEQISAPPSAANANGR
jgi:hypothetical protein